MAGSTVGKWTAKVGANDGLPKCLVEFLFRGIPLGWQMLADLMAKGIVVRESAGGRSTSYRLVTESWIAWKAR